MKKISLILLATILFSCGEKTMISNRPTEQVKFVNLMHSLREQVNAADKDKAKRSELLERGIPYVKQYIKDSLQLNFSAWEVRVPEIKENYPRQGETELKLGSAYDPTAIFEKAKYQSIVLSTQNPSGSKILDMLKDIKAGDYVRVSGNFIEKEGFIDIDSFSAYKFSKNIFDNPEFKSEMSEIEKIQ